MNLGRHIRHVTYYGNRPRRAQRRLTRYAQAVVNPRNHPRGRALRGYWFDQFPNFGDALTPWLLQEAGYMPQLALADEAEVSGVGSILEMLPSDFRGAVWGSGLLYGKARTLPNARWLAVRGAMTRDLVQAPETTALGDPGILVSRFLRPKKKETPTLGLVPHHAQLSDELWENVQRLRPDSIVIDPVGSPKNVVSQIAGCSHVVTSSLHGLITADAFQVPAVWVVLPGNDLRGGEFKFHDYESAYPRLRSRRIEAISAKGVLTQADPLLANPDAGTVRGFQDSLLDALSRVDHRAISPFRNF